MNAQDATSTMPDGLLPALCNAYADLLRRQRTSSSTLVTWSDENQRSHEFVWISGAFDTETLMTDGNDLRVPRQSSIFDAVQKMHATSQLNPYEREILYGYPYVIGRLGGRTVRAPLFVMPVSIRIEGSGFIVDSADEVVRLNTLPFRSETDVAAREQAIERLLQQTPPFPLGTNGAKTFVQQLIRELPEVKTDATLDGRLPAPPARPSTGSYLQLVDQAAIFVAPSSSYFLVSDLMSIGAQDHQYPADYALTPLLIGAGTETQSEFEMGAEDTETISYPFPSNRAQRRAALLIDDPRTKVVHIKGPPGTGKSLTIANLACHLAATGRSVLITSQKDKALQVVDAKLRELGLDQIPMTLLRQERSSKQELRNRLDSIEKTRSAEEAVAEAAKFKEEFKGQKERYKTLQSLFASAMMAEREYEVAEKAIDDAKGRLRRLAATWRFKRTRRRLDRNISAGTDEVAQEASRQRRRLLDGALAMLKAELERATSTAKRDARQQLREFSSLLRRDERSYRNFSIFDRLKAQPDRTAMLLKVLPVWIMTPDDAARLFPCQPGLFDVVIIDEASQVDLPSIMPILYRAKKVVISGDPHQMQASRFIFTQELIALEAWHQYGMQFHDPDNWLQPTKQSLLGLASVRAQEEVFLNEHFRSLPPIIDFSNRRWYTPPGLRIMTDESQKRFGDPDQAIIELHHVKDGIITNESQENLAEAQALVTKLKDLLEHPAYADASFGVICLFAEQVRLVQDLVADQIDPELWSAHQLVVVNPDGFQGDERDVILYSLSFDNKRMLREALSARQANRDHVQGMLNVAFTRARDEIHVFHSAPIEDFTFADGKSGTLTDWLTHCASMKQPRRPPASSRLGRSDSIFESEVAACLVERGYKVTQQYPACGFFIDMVVEADGDRLALECDGPTHFDEHGERTVEDLDRLDVLERAGWRILHITYRNWRERPGEQLGRIDAWFRDSLQENDTLAENVEKHQASSDGPTASVSWQGKAIIDALCSGIRDEEAVFKASLPSLGWSKLGSRIRSDLQAAARELTRDGLIVIEDKEYFLTPKGRIAQPHVLERHTRQTPGLASTPQRFASIPSSSTQSGVRYPITCSRCGRPDTVPFKPKTSTGLLCRSCYYRRTR